MRVTGTTYNPGQNQDIIERESRFNEAREEERSNAADRLKSWQSFLATKEGRWVQQLAQPMIDHLQSLLSISPWEIKGNIPGIVSDEDVRLYFAEKRGELSTWRSILHTPTFLNKMLEEIENSTEEVDL